MTNGGALASYVLEEIPESPLSEGGREGEEERERESEEGREREEGK